MTGTRTREQSPSAARRGVAYAFLASALRYPDTVLFDEITSGDRWEDALTVVRGVDPEAADGLSHWGGRAFASRAVLSSVLADLQAAHVRLFGHAVRGACPPYEMEYGQGEIVQQAPELADITGFYSAFGLAPAAESHERADHVSAECEFMGVLAAKEAWLTREHDEAGLTVVQGAQARFVEAHLGRWLPALARRVEQADPEGFYGAIARFASSFIVEECWRFSVAVGPPLVELRPADPERDAAITCGVEESCPDGQSEQLVQVNTAHAHRI